MKMLDEEQFNQLNEQIERLRAEAEQVTYERFTHEFINKLYLHVTLLEKRAQVLRDWLPNSQELRELTSKLLQQQRGNTKELDVWSYLNHLKKNALDYPEFQEYCFEQAETHPYNNIVSGDFVSIVTETVREPKNIDRSILHKELDDLVKEYLEATFLDY